MAHHVRHRASTIRRADLVLVMEDGRIVERGSYQESMARGGVFAGLVQAQTLASGWPGVPTTT